MKKTRLLLLILVLPFFVNGQNSESRSDRKNRLKMMSNVPESIFLPERILQANLQQTDSIITTHSDKNYKKSEYKWDAAGNMILNAEYYWNTSTNSWKKIQKYEYEFDASGNMIKRAYYSSDYNGDTWVGDYKYEYAYDQNDNNIQLIYSGWNTDNNSWQYKSKNISLYDQDNRRTYSISYGWLENEWNENDIYENKYEYQTDDITKITTQLHYVNQTVSDDELRWKLNDKTETVYDEHGNKTLEAYYFPNGDLWRPRYMYEYTYDTNNIMIESVFSVSWQSGEWDSKEKIVNAYADNTFTTVEAEWNPEEGWKNQTKYVASGIENKRMSHEEEYSWVDTKWDNGTKKMYTYDADNKRITEVKHYTKGKLGWTYSSEKETYYYKKESSSLDDLQDNNSVRLHYNPASGHILILSSGNNDPAVVLNLFDFSGRNVLGKQAKVSDSVDISHFQTGVYIYRIESEGRVYNGKIIVK